jgi:hypothetical protein
METNVFQVIDALADSSRWLSVPKPRRKPSPEVSSNDKSNTAPKSATSSQSSRASETTRKPSFI